MHTSSSTSSAKKNTQTQPNSVYCERCGAETALGQEQAVVACPVCGHDQFVDSAAAVPTSQAFNASEDAKVEEASQESFPASDPPAWTATHP